MSNSTFLEKKQVEILIQLYPSLSPSSLLHSKQYSHIIWPKTEHGSEVNGLCAFVNVLG